MSGFLTYLWVSVRRWWIRWRAPKERPEPMTSVQKFDRSLVAVACVVASGLLAYLAVDNYREAEFRKINAETEYRIDRTYDELVRIKFLIDRMEAR